MPTRGTPEKARRPRSISLCAGVDAVTLGTAQVLESFWERAALPSILGMVMLASGTMAELNDPAKPNALANGQYILVSRIAYEALGGHAALRGEIAEDLEFARLLKRDGRFRMLLVAGGTLARVRMYHSLAEIRQGFTKNVFAGTKNDLPGLAGGIAFALTISALPPLLAMHAIRGRRFAEAAEALACTAATMAAASFGFGKARLPRRLAVYQPLGTALFATIAVNSAWRTLTGRGVLWRGRTYSGLSSGRAAGAEARER
jgi:chlorobactene glucosyltransferase